MIRFGSTTNEYAIIRDDKTLDPVTGLERKPVEHMVPLPKKSANTPRQKVKQETTYGTPLWLVKAIERDFGLKFGFDLAADEDSCVLRESDSAWDYKYYSFQDNSLAQDWNNLTGDLWLNPPFANIKDWCAKCSTYVNGTICLLVPASLGSKWFRDYCMGRPVYILDSRITFDGHTDPYPKDLMLVFFHSKDGKYIANSCTSDNKCLFQMGSYSVKSSQSQANVDKTKDSLRKLSELSEKYTLPD